MWTMPIISDFDPEDGVLSGVGKLKCQIFVELQVLSLRLIERACSPQFKEQVLVSQLSNILGNLLHRLEFIATSFITMCLGVRSLPESLSGTYSLSEL
jgi:hypothetical protein